MRPKKADLWACGASECNSQDKQEWKGDRSYEDSDYVPEPFPEEQLEPLERIQILATLDVCANETTPTKFCDDEGYENRHSRGAKHPAGQLRRFPGLNTKEVERGMFRQSCGGRR